MNECEASHFTHANLTGFWTCHRGIGYPDDVLDLDSAGFVDVGAEIVCGRELLDLQTHVLDRVNTQPADMKTKGHLLPLDKIPLEKVENLNFIKH